MQTLGHFLFHLTWSLFKMLLEGKELLEWPGEALHPLRGVRDEEEEA